MTRFSPLGPLDTDDAKDAREMRLTARPLSPEMRAFTKAVWAESDAALVAAKTTDKKRANKAGPGLCPDLEDATYAIVFDILSAWSADPPRLSFRAKNRAAFTAQPIGFRTFARALDSLVAAGFIHPAKSPIRYEEMTWAFDDPSYQSTGKATRYCPTDKLLTAAADAGINPENLHSHVTHLFSAKPPEVAEPVLLRPWRKSRDEAKPIYAAPDFLRDTEARRAREWVQSMNNFASDFDVRGCLPPRWCRKFTGTLPLHGRWYAQGSGGHYQCLRSEERSAITINGEAIAEIDVKASHLTIVHGLMHIPLPDDDPYGFTGLPRSVVKAWLTTTLGNGRFPKKWPEKIIKQSAKLKRQGLDTPENDLTRFSVRDIQRVVVARYPFLKDLKSLVADVNAPKGARGVVSNYLMGIEAEALTGAMMHLQGCGILALPLHDALIVPVSHVKQAQECLKGSFSYFAKIVPRFEVTLPSIHAQSESR